MATRKKATKKTTTNKPAATKENKKQVDMCGQCDNWLQTNECIHPASHCYGGRVNAKAKACDFFQSK